MLAEKMNMSVMQVYRLERGVRMCTIDNLIMLHEIFNVGYQYLLEGRESEKKSQLEEKVLEMLNLVHKL